MINWPLLVITIMFFFASLMAVGIFVQQKYIKRGIDFTVAGRTLPWWLVASGIILGPFGVGNSLALSESAWIFGASVLLWMACSSFMCVFSALGTGRWFRRLEAESVSEAYYKMFEGDVMVPALAAISAIMWLLPIASLEIYAIGAAFYGFTGFPIHISILIGFTFTFLYILFGGVIQYSILNLIYLVVIYIGIAFGLMGVTSWLNQIGGWEYVANAIKGTMGEPALHIAPIETIGTWLPFIFLPVFLGHVVCCYTGGCTQVALAVRDERELAKVFWITLFANGLWGYAWVLIGLAALVVPLQLYGPLGEVVSQLRALGQPGAVPATILTIMASGELLAGLILVALVAAALSTGSAWVLSSATNFMVDVVRHIIKPDITDRRFLVLLRIMTIVFAFLALGGSLFTPYILGSFIWCFSFGLPTVVVGTCALFWRRNRDAAIWTYITSWIVLMAWLIFSPAIQTLMPAWLHHPYGCPYPTLITALVVYIVLTLILPGTKPGLFRARR